MRFTNLSRQPLCPRRAEPPALALLLALASVGACNRGLHTDVATDTHDATTEAGDTTTGGDETDTEADTDTGGSSGDTVPEPAPAAEWPHLACDSLVPEYCGYPFPSNVFTIPAATETGRQVALQAEAVPLATSGTPSDPRAWDQNDGFSPGLAGMAFLPGATITDNVPGPWTIEASLQLDSPTILLNADTGELVAHFTELDMSHPISSKRSLMVRPAARLDDATRYIVALRDIRDASGEVIAPSAAFKALRDREPSSDDSVEDRRALYADIFQRLEAAGVARDDLQLAWDFTTASTANITGRLVHIRDHALDQVGAAGPSYTFKSVQFDSHENIAIRLEVDMTVPVYLDDPGPGGVMVLDDDGLPTQQGTAVYPVLVLIPYSAFEHVSPPLGYGHGLLGDRTQLQSGTFRAFAEDFHYTLFAVDWIGMSNSDLGVVYQALTSGAVEKFESVVDRGQQGVLNFMLATRMLNGALAGDTGLVYKGDARPDLLDKMPMIDTEHAYYFGNSQGGIFGGTLMAVYTDVTRGLLGVPGQPYNLLLNRSVDFDPYLAELRNAYPDPIDLQMVLALVQMLWDRSEPVGYTRYIREDTLPGTPAHDVVLQVAINDHQVTTLGAHNMARTIGDVPNIDPNREIYGVPSTSSPHTGSGMIEWDYGQVPEPIVNVPPDESLSDDPHGWPRKEPESQLMLDKFLREGVIDSFCDGPCQRLD